MRVLLTGATGFVGSQVMRALIRRGDEVRGITLPGASRARLADLGPVDVLEGDLADAAWVGDCVRSFAPGTAIHLAWYAEPGAYLRSVPENLASLRGSVNLFEALAAAGSCRRLVVAGTCLENLGSPAPTIYEAAKAAQHRLAMGLAGQGIAAACVHIHYLYGPGEDERRVVPSVVRALLARRPIDVGDGLQERDYLHVSDVAEAVCAVAASDLVDRVDVCTGSPVRLRDVFDRIADATDGHDLLRIGALPAGESMAWPATGDPAPLQATGWRPRYDLRAGIEDTVAWWAAHDRNRG
jgi:nucleoside-diphosphate-sugar epimerase